MIDHRPKKALDVIAHSLAMHLAKGRSEEEALARSSKSHSYASAEVMDIALGMARKQRQTAQLFNELRRMRQEENGTEATGETGNGDDSGAS